MEEVEHKVDRTGWPAGEWDGEPDRLQWTDKATDMACLIVRNRMGGLCGYVAVEHGHPLYGKSYDSDAADVEVHGGLTYSDRCAGHICHVPEPGKPDDVWWLGFDCSHAYDLSPGMLKYDPPETYEEYRPIAYVQGEVTSLAKQLHEMQ